MDSNSESFEDLDQYLDGSFLPYDESLEPVANEEEAAQYQVDKNNEDEEHKKILSRFLEEVELETW